MYKYVDTVYQHPHTPHTENRQHTRISVAEYAYIYIYTHTHTHKYQRTSAACMHASAFIENTHKHTVTGIYRGNYKHNAEYAYIYIYIYTHT
jgi:hypothetical protein